jgi:hypothetical protein
MEWKMKNNFIFAFFLFLSVLCGFMCPTANAEQDHYEQYVKTSKDFKCVNQEKEWIVKAFGSWTYMPWSYQWNIGYDDASGQWSIGNGYNGAFLDHGQTIVDGVNKLEWINKFKMRFYVDHTASKGYLHLWDGGDFEEHAELIHSTELRAKPVNNEMKDKLKEFILQYVNNVKSSPYRAAYALDDEISWGHFVHPCMWQVTDDFSAYREWLTEIYGPDNAPRRSEWISYDAILPKLKEWSIKDFDCSELMDQWSFNDSYWNNFIVDLVDYCNGIDPATPCGFVGGQSPNAFGGYDYAKVMRKVQFIESYNLGSSQAIIRSFNPQNALPTVTTHFHKNVDDSVWQTWYYLAHGNRGFIGWVQDWFDGKEPKSFHAAMAPHYTEAANTIGPLMKGAEWIHDGVAIYYSHPSIQLGWILDAEAHRQTWRNRNNDHNLGASHLVRRAWENMLRDEGLQYNFISYVDVIQNGIPKEYKVLILPATLCLSDVEGQRIKEFCRAGGTVIADYLPGLWDQHGRGRKSKGALDDMFGVSHDMNMKAEDIFQRRLWAEVDQDVNYNWKDYEEFLSNKNDCIKDLSGFYKAVRKMPADNVNTFGNGKAVLMNLSPQWYNAYRQSIYEDAFKRNSFIKHIKRAGLKRRVWLEPDDDKIFGYEITYWKKGGRIILFVCFNPETTGSSTGGGNSVGLKTENLSVTLKFEQAIRNVHNERTGQTLSDGNSFNLNWKTNEAAVISFTSRPQK